MKRILTVIGLLLGFCQGNVTAQEDLDAEYAKDLLKPGTEVPAIMVGESGSRTNWLQRDKPQYTILEFWASWCGDCRRDMAKMRRINRVFCSDSIYIKGYSFDTKAESWEKCQKDSVLAWSHQLSPVTMRDSEVAKAFHLNWIPSYYLVGKDGLACDAADCFCLDQGILFTGGAIFFYLQVSETGVAHGNQLHAEIPCYGVYFNELVFILTCCNYAHIKYPFKFFIIESFMV